MKLKSILSAVGMLCVFATGLAYAEHDGNKEHSNMFKEADTNHDGKVSLDEFKVQHEKRIEEMFKKIDTNGDGFIDEVEAKAGHEKMREKMKELRKGQKGRDDMPSQESN